MATIQQPLHSTKLTRTFRNISRIYNKVNFIIDIVLCAIFGLVGVILLPIGIAAISDPTIFADAETTMEAAEAMGIALSTIGGSFLIAMLCFAIFAIYRGIISKFIIKPTHKQYLGLAITSFIVGLDSFMTAFFVIIYIFEGRKEKQDALIAGEQDA